jgi:hypothetical protein
MKCMQKIAGISLSALCLGSALAVLLSGPAAADDFSGLFAADYANVSGSNHISISDGGFAASGQMALGDTGFNAQVDGGINSASGTTNANIYNIDGLFYYRTPEGQFGGLGDYISTVGMHSTHVIPYGGFGEYYFSDQITAGLEGGGLSSRLSSGEFVEGHLTGYVTPDFSIKGFDTYISVSHGQDNNIGVQAEYLITEAIPISVYAGYAYTDISHTGVPDTTLNTFFIGLKLYTNGTGAPLVSSQRNGVVDTSDLISAVRYGF